MQSQDFYFETPNPNKTSNNLRRQKNINNQAFEDQSSKEEYNRQTTSNQPQSTKHYKFKIVEVSDDKNNNNNNSGLIQI